MILIALSLIIGLAVPISATQHPNMANNSEIPAPNNAPTSWEAAMEATLDWMLEISPQAGAAVGEWAILALARAQRLTIDDPWAMAWLTDLDRVISEVDEILAANPSLDINNPPSASTFPAALRRWTDFQRVTIALSALGIDGADFRGRNMTEPFQAFVPTPQRHATNRTILADIFALIALDTMDYDGDREQFLSHILDVQRADGTWSLNPAQPASVLDLDITAMAIQALAPYYIGGDAIVIEAVEKALQWLQTQEFPDPESTAQMVIALTALGPAYAEDAIYYVEWLLRWFDPAAGAFRQPTLADPVNHISTVQAAYALVAYWRLVNGASSLYAMSGDFEELTVLLPLEATENEIGLPGRHQDVRIIQVIHPGRTFDDIQNHPNQVAMEALAARGIINGRSETRFEPDATMTRAEFAAIITRGLGLPEKPVAAFEDVPPTAWFSTAVGTAFYYGIITGASPTIFNPGGTLTRQEAAVMITRAARLCGMDTTLSELEVLNILAIFGDYRAAASWAWEAFAFCYREGILDDYEFYILPTAIISRSEVAEMLYRLLYMANLL